MLQKKLTQVDYPLFRKTLNEHSSKRVKNRGSSTLLYDNRNKLVAMLKAASIDPCGASQPARYYIHARFHQAA